ncbi:MAG: transcriptional repressor [Bacteroidia bacterium]|nr:transcriptional repressor [Bacteroidia bacterium]
MNRVNTILQQKSIRITPMRQLVLRHILQEEAVFGLNKLEEALPKSDRITLFRTLKTFEEKGIIHSIPNGTSEVKYALCKEHCGPGQHLDFHPHFLCIKCDHIECIESVNIPKLHIPEGYIGLEFNLTIKGICIQCEN